MQLFHRDIVIMVQTYVSGTRKKRLTETVLLSTHNTCIRHALFSVGLSKHMDLFCGHFRVSHNYLYFRETITFGYPNQSYSMDKSRHGPLSINTKIYRCSI